jgi:hypothetical protein
MARVDDVQVVAGALKGVEEMIVMNAGQRIDCVKTVGYQRSHGCLRD